MATKQLEKSTQRRHKFFASENQAFTQNAIYIPDSPLFLKNNCKEGNWQLGDTNYGNRLKLAALKFSRYLHIGNDSIDPGTPIGQLWFCPLDGADFSRDLLFKRSLRDPRSGARTKPPISESSFSPY